MPWHEGKSWEDLEQYIEEEGYMVSDLVNDEIEAFWEPYEHPCDDCAFGSMST